MEKPYSLEKAMNEANKIKELAGDKSTKDDIECAEQIIDEENELREKKLRTLAKKIFQGCEIKFSPTEIENISNFDKIRPVINKVVSAFRGLGLYNLTERNFPEKKFDTDKYYHGKNHFHGKMNELLEDLVMERLKKLGIQSYDDFKKALKENVIKEESFDGLINKEVINLENFPKNYRDRFFYFLAVYKYTQKHPKIKDDLPDRYSTVNEREEVEKYGLQRPFVRITHHPQLDLSTESEFPNPSIIEKYNSDHPELVLYPGYNYSVTRKVSTVSGTKAESLDGIRVDELDSLEEYTHIISLKWYTSLATAATRTKETIKKTEMRLQPGKSVLDIYNQYEKRRIQDQMENKIAGSLKKYSFESFERDIHSVGVFMLDNNGKFIKPVKENNLSEGRYGRADRKKGITRFKKIWENTPRGVTVISYEIKRNKANTRISINFKLEIKPPQGLSSTQKNRVKREIEKIKNSERKKMPKVKSFDVKIEDDLK